MTTDEIKNTRLACTRYNANRGKSNSALIALMCKEYVTTYTIFQYGYLSQRDFIYHLKKKGYKLDVQKFTDGLHTRHKYKIIE